MPEWMRGWYVWENGETAVELWPDGSRHCHIVCLRSYSGPVPPFPGMPDLVFPGAGVEVRKITFTNPREPENPGKLPPGSE